MLWGALAAGPLALFFNGAGLVLSYATLHARGDDVTKAEPIGFGIAPTLLLFGIFFRVGARGLSRAEFWPVTGIFFGAQLVAVVTMHALLDRLGFSTIPSESLFVTTLVMTTAVILTARLNTKAWKAG